ncbi:MAG: MOSC domain-containing protein [Hyphomicrobiaceae bacterium]|nr:MOSC domain-containing protein [Hyphomicrobiaceae bacterium]
MSDTDSIRVSSLHRYPVKGLRPQDLAEVSVEAGETLPYDRAWAIENGRGRFDPNAPKHLPKINFLMLMRNERLAALEVEFDEATHTLTLLRNGKQVVRGALDTAMGRQLIEQFMAGYMENDLRGAPHIVNAPGHNFTDVAIKCVHIVNLASVRELERAVGRPVDPMRFRANVYIESQQPWEEFGWVGQRIRIGGTVFDVIDRTTRCAATNVDPQTADRDMAIPAALMRAYGHEDFGVYATVAERGTIRRGDTVTLISERVTL